MNSKRHIKIRNGQPQKLCPVCKRWLSLTDRYFSVSNRHADGFLTYCKECCSNIQRLRRAKAREAGAGGFKVDADSIAASAEILKPQYWLVNSNNYLERKGNDSDGV